MDSKLRLLEERVRQVADRLRALTAERDRLMDRMQSPEDICRELRAVVRELKETTDHRN